MVQSWAVGALCRANPDSRDVFSGGCYLAGDWLLLTLAVVLPELAPHAMRRHTSSPYDALVRHCFQYLILYPFSIGIAKRLIQYLGFILRICARAPRWIQTHLLVAATTPHKLLQTTHRKHLKRNLRAINPHCLLGERIEILGMMIPLIQFTTQGILTS